MWTRSGTDPSSVSLVQPVVVVHEPHIDIVNIVSIIFIVFFLAMLVQEFVRIASWPASS